MGAILRLNARRALVAANATTALTVVLLGTAMAQPRFTLPACSKIEGNDGGALRPVSVQTLSDPLVGQIKVAEIGQPILTAIEAAQLPDVLILKESIAYTGRGPAIGFQITVPAGVLKVSRDTRDFALYRAEAGVVIKDGRTAEATVEIVRKADLSQALRLSWIHRSSSFFGTSFQPFADDLPDVSYELRGCMAPARSNHRKEIIYSGFAGKSLSLMYREYSGDFMRPAFSQSLTYDLNAGDEIGVKGARLRVISANNVSITVEVLRGFD